MVNFLKTFAKGLLYIIALPLLILGLAVYFVISLFSFIVIGVKAIVIFFKGGNAFGDLPEDIEAKKRLGLIPDTPEVKEEEKEETKEEIKPIQEEVSIVNTPIFEPEPEPIPEPEIPFEPEIENEPSEEPIHESSIVEEEPPLEDMFDDNVLNREESHEEVNIESEEIKEEAEDQIPYEKEFKEDIYINTNDDDNYFEEDSGGVDIISHAEDYDDD